MFNFSSVWTQCDMTEINNSMSICTFLVKTGQIFDTTSALFTAGLIPYIANRLIWTDACKNPKILGPKINISWATRTPYSSHDIEFNHITKDVVKGNAVVDFSCITVLITARGDPLNKTDKKHPRTPIRGHFPAVARHKARDDVTRAAIYNLFGLVMACS